MVTPSCPNNRFRHPHYLGERQTYTHTQVSFITTCFCAGVGEGSRSSREREAMIERRSLPLLNHKRRQGSACLLYHKSSKQVLCTVSFVQYRHRGGAGRFCLDHGARFRSRPTRTEQKSLVAQGNGPASPQLLSKRHPPPTTPTSLAGERDSGVNRRVTA